MIMPLPGVGRHPYISVLKKTAFEVPTSGNICKVLVTNGSLKWYLTTVKASLFPFMIFKKEKKKVKRRLKQISNHLPLQNTMLQPVRERTCNSLLERSRLVITGKLYCTTNGQFFKHNNVLHPQRCLNLPCFISN